MGDVPVLMHGACLVAYRHVISFGCAAVHGLHVDACWRYVADVLPSGSRFQVLQRATSNALPAVAGVPLAVLAPIIGNIFSALRGLVPV